MLNDFGSLTFWMFRSVNWTRTCADWDCSLHFLHVVKSELASQVRNHPVECIFTSFIDKFCRFISELFVYIIIDLIMISQTLIHCLNKYILKEKHILFLRNELKYFIEKYLILIFIKDGKKNPLLQVFSKNCSSSTACSYLFSYSQLAIYINYQNIQRQSYPQCFNTFFFPA